MKRILLLLMIAGAALVVAVGCSDDDKSVSPTGPSPSSAFADTSVYDSATDTWTATLNASSYAAPVLYSFSDAKAAGWDVQFFRANINLNGGDAGTEGVVGADLGAAKGFDAITLADTTGAAWVEDEHAYIIDSFYIYNFITHQLDMTQYVYAMVDAESDNFVKFRIDSLVGAGAPPSMGTVWITYYYQPAANNRTVSGAAQTASINVGAGAGYFDFSTGAQVFPANPQSSTGWDLMFSSYVAATNSGPNGAGGCAVFPAYTELNDNTDIDAFTEVPENAQFFPDFTASVFNGSLTDSDQLWYNYNGQNHTLSSRSHVYLIKTAGAVYKMEIVSYYADINGGLASGYYTFKWSEL